MKKSLKKSSQFYCSVNVSEWIAKFIQVLLWVCKLYWLVRLLVRKVKETGCNMNSHLTSISRHQPVLLMISHNLKVLQQKVFFTSSGMVLLMSSGFMLNAEWCLCGLGHLWVKVPRMQEQLPRTLKISLCLALPATRSIIQALNNVMLGDTSSNTCNLHQG